MMLFTAVAEIIICFFSVLGVYFLVTHISDRIVKKNAPSESAILIEYCADTDLEYLVRFYESRIINGDFEGMINGIVIGRTVTADAELLDKLFDEFDNISRL